MLLSSQTPAFKLIEVSLLQVQERMKVVQKQLCFSQLTHVKKWTTIPSSYCNSISPIFQTQFASSDKNTVIFPLKQLSVNSSIISRVFRSG